MAIHGRGFPLATQVRPRPPTVASDTTPPVANITAGPTASRISRIAGKDTFTFDWSSNENFTSYQIRVVSNASDTYVMGTLLEQDQNPAAGGTASTTYQATITDDEVVAAAPGDGSKLLKIFIRDAAGNWSS